MANVSMKIAEILNKASKEVLGIWQAELKAAGADVRISEAELKAQTSEFLALLGAAASHGTNLDAAPWKPVRAFLEAISRSRAVQGFSADETATFVLSLKKAVFARLATQFARDPKALATETWAATELFDKLALYTINCFQRSREEVIRRQQEELLELSTPVVKLWDGIVALPMIGTLDSARTQVVMQSLLQRIVEIEAEVAIIDITGVPTVDTMVAQHLLKTVTAIRLMGADCIISGIRPQIAQTIVHLGVELGDVTTKANLADALVLALERTGMTVTKLKSA
jgi:rsbT co-antagonist protein RsbR